MTNDFLMHSDATFDTGGDEMWFEKAGQAMLFPCFEGFYFNSFHKPATTSNIGPPLYDFLLDSDATCDSGAG